MEDFTTPEFVPEPGSKLEQNFARIALVREVGLQDQERIFKFNEKLFGLNERLKEGLEEKFGDGSLRKKVLLWQQLTGGVSNVCEVEEDVEAYVVAEIEQFLSDIETEWGIV